MPGPLTPDDGSSARTEILSETEKRLRDWNIAYEKTPEGRLRINGNLDISNKHLSVLPDFSEVEVTGSFDCSHNTISSLAGSPYKVGKHMNCDETNIRDLEGAPRTVGGDFTCRSYFLLTLRGGPERVGGTMNVKRDYSELANLFGAPREFGKLKSRFGTYRAWADIPPNLRNDPRDEAPRRAAPRVETEVKPAPPPPEVPAAADLPAEVPAVPSPGPWKITGEHEVARSTLKTGLNYKITEIFNFEAGLYTQLARNMETNAETQTALELAALPSRALVAKAAEALQRQGGRLPEGFTLPGELPKLKPA
jgi:hypothetical protein